jgi:hypothetical protein
MLTLVLTMGRVGSSATFNAIKELDGVQAVHLHHLAEESLAPLGQPLPRHGADTVRVRKLLAERPDEPVKVITLVRDLASRNLSAGFARLRRLAGDDRDEMRRLIDEPPVISDVWRRLDWRMPFGWFDVEIRDQLGVDVFATPFPDAGVATSRSGRFELLVMRSDVDNGVKSAAVGALLGRAVDLKQGSTRTQAGGGLRPIYDAFSATTPWGSEEFQEMGRSRVMRHFFGVQDPDRYASDRLAQLGR